MNEPIRFRCLCGSLNVLVSWQPFSPAVGAYLLFNCRDCGRRGQAPINGENPSLGQQTWMLFDDEMRKIAPKHSDN